MLHGLAAAAHTRQTGDKLLLCWVWEMIRQPIGMHEIRPMCLGWLG